MFIFPVIVWKEETSSMYIPKRQLAKTVQEVLDRSEMGSRLRFIGSFSVFPDDAETVADLQRNVLNVLHEVYTVQFKSL